jgi:hypothetical protein
MGRMSAKGNWGVPPSSSKRVFTQSCDRPGAGMVKKTEPANSCQSYRPGFMPASPCRNHDNYARLPGSTFVKE